MAASHNRGVKILTRGPNPKYGTMKVDTKGGMSLTAPNRLHGAAKSPYGKKVI